MSFILRTGLTVIFAGVCALAQPAITSVLNSASYVTPSAGPAPIAQGCIFVVIGTGLSGTTLVQASSLPLETTMAGTSIAVTSGGQTVNAFMVYTLANAVAAILPSTAPVGQATVVLTYNNQASKPFTINVARSVPGLYTLNAQGRGPAAAQIQTTVYRLNNLTTPGMPGSQVVLYGTGLGPISARDDMPSGGAISGGINVTATVGGVPAQVIYAARSYFPGEDQVNIILPPNVPLSCYTPAVITVDGIPSNTVTISTSSSSNSCTHPFGLSQSAEATLDAYNTVNVGVFAAIRGSAQGLTAEGAGGLFETANYLQLFETYREILTSFSVIYFPAPIGGCVVYDELAGAPSGSVVPNDFTGIGSKELQSATVLTLNGPNNASANIGHTLTSTNTYLAGGGYLWINLPSAAVPAVLGPGSYTLAGAAGPDMASFSATTQFPANLVWTNMGNLTAPPVANGITMTWTGGGTTVQPNVWIFGGSSVYNTVDPSKNRGKAFSCIVPASASPFLIPDSVTRQLPTPGANEVEVGSLGISTGGGSRFIGTLTNGTPLDGTFLGFGEAFVNSGSGFAWK